MAIMSMSAQRYTSEFCLKCGRHPELGAARCWVCRDRCDDIAERRADQQRYPDLELSGEDEAPGYYLDQLYGRVA
jgi:hypothetical protein